MQPARRAGAVVVDAANTNSALFPMFGIRFLKVAVRSGSNSRRSRVLHHGNTNCVFTDSHDKAYNGNLSSHYNNFIDPSRSSNRRSVFHGT